MKTDQKPFHESVAEKLIEQLRAGTAPWQKPWEPGAAGTNMPINPTTGRRYKGINALHLMSEGRRDQRWLTYKQAAAIDAQVRRGEKGTLIQFWKFTEDQVTMDGAGKRIIDASGRPATQAVELERPRVFFATVFNAEQIDGMPPMEARREKAWTPSERAEQILKASGAVIRNGEHDRPFYRPATDSIYLPERSRFASADNYYATALHELGHWSGHHSRLNRDLIHPFGSEGYAREELRAEIASMILGDALGIGHDPAQHAAYVGAWIKALKDDPLEIFRAAADAEKIQAYVLDLAQTRIQEPVNLDLFADDARLTTRTENKMSEAAMEMPQQGMSGQAIGAIAEVWTRSRIEQGTLARALDSATVAQMNRMREAMDAMLPLNAENPFWQRHTLPQAPGTLREKIGAMRELLESRAADAPVAAARLAMLTKRAQGKVEVNDGAAVDDEAFAALGFGLPRDWNGRVKVRSTATGDVNGKPVVSPAPAKGAEPEVWNLYAEYDGGGQHWLTDRPSEELADALAERLAWIDARSTIDEFEKAVKLAGLHEERVRRNPDSTDEDISSASKARKDAEFLATTNDADLRRRIKEEARNRPPQTPSPSNAVDGDPNGDRKKLLISVPFKQKDEAKALGAKWNRWMLSWYIPSGLDQAPFAKWVAAGDKRPVNEDPAKSTEARHYLAVPYVDRVAARAAGAEWDKGAKSWFAPPGADMAELSRWLPENVPAQQDPAMSPTEEFAEALTSIGCVVGGDHPIMDGKKHRITVEGEKFSKNSGSGFYVGHLDDHPAGYMKNNKTGAELTWKSKGYTLDAEQKARLAAEAAAKLRQREADLAKRQDQAAQRVLKQLDKLIPALQPTPYMLAKGIEPHAGAFTDKEGRKTYLPAIDVDGKQWTMQYIDDNGTKRFAKDSRKEGCFHVVGGREALDSAPAIVIGEGYATAASLKQALGYATVCAFDSGNLAAVAEALHRRFPDKPLVIAGDDDRHLEAVQGVNPGRLKAEDAATRVGGTVAMPIFAPGENTYPAGLDPVTPAKYRAHRKNGGALGREQLDALDRMKQFTDFNDLAAKSALCRDGFENQVRSFVDAAIKRHSLARVEREHQQQQDRRPDKALGTAKLPPKQAETPGRRRVQKSA